MVTLDQVQDSLLRPPSTDPHPALIRAPSAYRPLRTFHLPRDRPYRQQYSDMYFLRLTCIKPAVERVAHLAWEGAIVGGEPARRAERVLDVRQGKLCWVVGTVYMDMRLKPSILDDVTNDRWMAAPVTTDKYWSDDGSDEIALEDDSGRIRLVGAILKTIPLVTGCIIAVMGTENANGELDVIDLKFADLPPQPPRWTLTTPPPAPQDTEMPDVSSPQKSDLHSPGKKIAFVSGLAFGCPTAALALPHALLLEFLLGEALTPRVQPHLAQISRLVILGNSVSMDEARPATAKEAENRRIKKYGYDANTYNPVPSRLFDDWLAEVLVSMPITLVPGEKDPANASYPQQPVHAAMFPRSRAFARPPGEPEYKPAQPPQQPQKPQPPQKPKQPDPKTKSQKGKPEPPQATTTTTTAANDRNDDDNKEPPWFHATTNPVEAEIEGWRVLCTGGQNVSDVFKYIDSDDRLGMMEAMCRWRCCAPTAPDTLWTYPFQDRDPFVLEDCPHLYVVGCQPRFGTRTVVGPHGQNVRLVSVPAFSDSCEIVLVDVETLNVSRVRFSVPGVDGMTLDEASVSMTD